MDSKQVEPPNLDASNRILSTTGERFDRLFANRVERSVMFRGQLLIKRCLDVLAAFMLLIFVSPLVAISAAVFCASSPGAPFFLGKRAGRNGKEFSCFKLRTMHLNQESLLARHGLSKWGGESRLLVYDDDPRINKIGTLLRKLSIDELPQLWNVVVGSMSLVGPRPLAIEMLEEFPEIRLARGVMRPGITGLWQVRNRMKNASVLDMINDDGEYIATYSLLSDFRILLRTLPKILEPARFVSGSDS